VVIRKRDDLLIIQISALEHWAYCPRQCALIHIDQIYEENIFTIRGSIVHKAVDKPTVEWCEGKRIERALPLWSDSLGISGRADSVEFHDDGRIYPVEKKLGKKRITKPDDIQLCAQVLCLEEMLRVRIERGAISSHQSRRRREVEFTEDLRTETTDTIDQVRIMIHSGRLPEPLNDNRCRDCSLADVCNPDIISACRDGEFENYITDLYEVEE